MTIAKFNTGLSLV